VFHNGHIYGLDDGILECVDPLTCKRIWKDGRYQHGQVLLAGDLLIVQMENGQVALVEAAPAGWRELGRFTALSGKTWNNPALAGRYLLVRNDHEAACYELPVVGSQESVPSNQQ
jgi:outer membrane protein assembly factor BamB